MRWKKNLYFAHRWIALIVSLQLLTWSVSGFTFTLLDIDDVHGDLDRRHAAAVPLRVEDVAVSPRQAVDAAIASGMTARGVSRMTLRERFGKTVYELFDPSNQPIGAVDAIDGRVISHIQSAEAVAVALADFAADVQVREINLLEGEAPLEFRGGPMPVYQVILEHAKEPHIYVSPVTGKVLKRRNRPWRIFDFFWMLHIMDYRQREDFNHWLLTGMSALAIGTSLTGIGLWVTRWGRWRRRPRTTEPANHA